MTGFSTSVLSVRSFLSPHQSVRRYSRQLVCLAHILWRLSWGNTKAASCCYITVILLSIRHQIDERQETHVSMYTRFSELRVLWLQWIAMFTTTLSFKSRQKKRRNKKFIIILILHHSLFQASIEQSTIEKKSVIQNSIDSHFDTIVVTFVVIHTCKYDDVVFLLNHYSSWLNFKLLCEVQSKTEFDDFFCLEWFFKFIISSAATCSFLQYSNMIGRYHHNNIIMLVRSVPTFEK